MGSTIFFLFFFFNERLISNFIETKSELREAELSFTSS